MNPNAGVVTLRIAKKGDPFVLTMLMTKRFANTDRIRNRNQSFGSKATITLILKDYFIMTRMYGTNGGYDLCEFE